MKKSLWLLGLIAIIGAPLKIQSDELLPVSPGAISISLDSVPLEDIIRLLSRITGVNLLYKPDDLRGTKPVSLYLNNQPWLPAFQSMIAAQGFALLEDPEGRKIYTLIKTDGPDVAVRIQYSTAAIALAETVLSNIKSNRLEEATSQLQAFADSNRTTLKSLKPPEKASGNQDME